MRLLIIAIVSAGLFASTVGHVRGQENTSNFTSAKPAVNNQAVASQLALVPVSGSKLAANANYCAYLPYRSRALGGTEPEAIRFSRCAAARYSFAEGSGLLRLPRRKL